MCSEAWALEKGDGGDAYGHVNPAAYKGVTDTNIVKALSLNDPTVLDRTLFTPIVSEADRDQFGQLWARVKAAR